MKIMTIVNVNSTKNILNKKTSKRIQSEQAIMLAAQHLFAKNGFDATTSKEIARDADLAEGLIFKYFHDKKGLLQHLMQNWFDKNLNELIALPQDPNNLKNELSILLNWIFNSYYHNLELHKIAIATRLNSNRYSEFEEACEKYINKRKQLIYSRLVSLQQNGQIKKSTNLEHLYEIIQSYAMTEALFLKLEPDQYKISIKGLINILVNGL
ncbi:MAG: transcriptional regulator [Burkholderiales bacterium]|jgi:AcrR family transcriptional regulator|nr:transcriptional regulator [Burkholderiales bacterium]